MKRLKEKTTILLVNKNQQSMKPIVVSTKLIKHWKKYAFGLILMFVTCGGIIALLASDRKNQLDKQALLAQKIESLHTLVDEIDTAAIRVRFLNINKEIKTVRGFLEARGIKSVFKEPMGGALEDEDLSVDEMSDVYEANIRSVGNDLAVIPIGYPYHGKITSNFGSRENPFSGSGFEKHKGLDIKGPHGAPVKSMAKGFVKFAGINGGYGKCIIIKHGKNFETLYGHLSKIVVKEGQEVLIGQHIGNIGSTGRSTGPHLHYEIRQNGKKLNPQTFLTLN